MKAQLDPRKTAPPESRVPTDFGLRAAQDINTARLLST